MASRYISKTLMQVEKPRVTCKKYLERRLIHAWKALSQATRKPQRASMLPEDFIMLTARRRSIRWD
ncbi:hypothetical protein OBBRIDRAFT_830121 [Obba rivulosa]|uniref:Uncharacterized protein n=1 Tax=Obba rivulosa TaxID=1052685 RepID=A0A8E2DV72_9APHY|nr:hypothetical protein OBBRIDRAFT_830121 [Obba rivulosa]